ncbi:MAG: shikimate dehydrogenase [Candidatus Bipolaricaulota bacterium]
MTRRFEAQRTPTIYFVGVTTSKSSIMKVFPRWADRLGLEAQIVGVDFALHDQPEAYRSVVEHIRSDSLSMGALVTTHKLDLLDACRDLFDELGPYATRLHEISGISKRGALLVGEAFDPLTSGLALDAFFPASTWEQGAGEVLLLGAGGSSLALTVNLLERADRGRPAPRRIIVSNRSPGRLEEMRRIHATFGTNLEIRYELAPAPEDNDRLLAAMPPRSLIINATGLGKDRPGSPISNEALFPEGSWAWDFNYRGDLLFLAQARGQSARRQIHVEDGWVYFLHGWTRVISAVFHIQIPTQGPAFDALSSAAREVRNG